jgi:hypothetical protein
MTKKHISPAVDEVTIENAHKITFLVESYPNHTLAKIIELLQMPAIDINAATWYAQEEGWITQVDEETGMVALAFDEHVYHFGKSVTNLEEKLLYCFEKLASKETDLEENYLSNWTLGYPAHDVMIALRDLEEDGLLAQYQIEDGENKYIFFTLAENKDKVWGQKQFKANPMDAPSAPSE